MFAENIWKEGYSKKYVPEYLAKIRISSLPVLLSNLIGIRGNGSLLEWET